MRKFSICTVLPDRRVLFCKKRKFIAEALFSLLDYIVLHESSLSVLLEVNGFHWGKIVKRIMKFEMIKQNTYFYAFVYIFKLYYMFS